MLAACFILLATCAWADDAVPPQDKQPGLTELGLEELMNIEVISASKKLQKLSETPAAVFVITRDDIRRYGYRNLAEALFGSVSDSGLEVYGSFSGLDSSGQGHIYFPEFDDPATNYGVAGGLDDEQAVKDKTVNGRKLQVKRFDNVRNVERCHILFISASEKMRLSKALERTKDLNVLTVSDIGGFARRGGIIGFTMERNKVGFEINVDAAKKAELTISSQLLKLAKVVGG